jgi:hypothetical protein
VQFPREKWANILNVCDEGRMIMAASVLEVARDLVIAWIQNQAGSKVLKAEEVGDAYRKIYDVVLKPGK